MANDKTSIRRTQLRVNNSSRDNDLRPFLFVRYTDANQKNTDQTVPTNSGGATYAPEDLPPKVAALSLLNESAARQALFSEKEPKMPENI
jgi:hypothetical protein